MTFLAPLWYLSDRTNGPALNLSDYRAVAVVMSVRYDYVRELNPSDTADMSKDRGKN